MDTFDKLNQNISSLHSLLSKHQRLKFCICFFGLIRCGKKTIPTIQKNIYEVLEKYNIDYDIYLHTYDVSVVNVPRNSENYIKVDNTEWKQLNPDVYSITSQNEFDKTYDYDSISKFGLTSETKLKDTFHNMFRQLNSLRIVTEMWMDKDYHYDLYLYIRPDLYYTTELPLKDILKNKEFLLKKEIMFLPNWGTNIKMSLMNDRIAFGTKQYMLQYGKRINDVISFCEGNGSGKKRAYHPETFIHYLYEKYLWNISYIQFVGKRCRANCKLDPKDNHL